MLLGAGDAHRPDVSEMARNPRATARAVRAVPAKAKPFEMPPVWEEPTRAVPPIDDPRAVAHAAALLEAYMRHATPIASPQRRISAPRGRR